MLRAGRESSNAVPNQVPHRTSAPALVVGTPHGITRARTAPRFAPSLRSVLEVYCT